MVAMLSLLESCVVILGLFVYMQQGLVWLLLITQGVHVNPLVDDYTYVNVYLQFMYSLVAMLAHCSNYTFSCSHIHKSLLNCYAKLIASSAIAKVFTLNKM